MFGCMLVCICTDPSVGGRVLNPLLSSKERFFLIIMNHLAEYLEMLMAFDLLCQDKSFCPVGIIPFPPGAGGPGEPCSTPGGPDWETISLRGTRGQ